MDDREILHIASDSLTAAINPFGAELSSLKSGDREWIGGGDPAFWAGRAPLLFPTVGALAGGSYRLDGKTYALPQHGFARRQAFDLIEQAADRVGFRLTDNDGTRAVYPFAFALEARFVLVGRTLGIEVTATNRDARAMPVSFGFHPAFAWDRRVQTIAFQHPEPAPIRRLTGDGLIGPGEAVLPDRTLHIDDALFERGALIWPQVTSESVRFGDLDISFPGAPMLGIWSKPGAPFLCIEPWWGMADPQGFDGEIWDKPGIQRLEPGEARTFAMQVTVAG